MKRQALVHPSIVTRVAMARRIRGRTKHRQLFALISEQDALFLACHQTGFLQQHRPSQMRAIGNSRLAQSRKTQKRRGPKRYSAGLNPICLDRNPSACQFGQQGANRSFALSQTGQAARSLSPISGRIRLKWTQAKSTMGFG